MFNYISTYPMPKAGPVTIVLRSIYSNGAVNYMFFRACILKNSFLGSIFLAWNLLHAIYFVWYGSNDITIFVISQIGMAIAYA